MSTSSARASLWGRDPEEWSDPPSWSEAFQDNLVDNLLMMACHREVLYGSGGERSGSGTPLPLHFIQDLTTKPLDALVHHLHDGFVFPGSIS